VPLLLAEPLTAALADVVLERRCTERQVAELQRHCLPVDDERRAEAGAEPEEEHLAVLVLAERLHDRVVHDLRRLAERLLEVEPDPALAEVHGLAGDLPLAHGCGDADRDDIVVPVRGQFADALHHLATG
jgi:hypothetical protein